MQMPAIVKPSVTVVTPIHEWPQTVKSVVLTGAIVLCVAVYILLALGLVGLAVMTVNLIAG